MSKSKVPKKPKASSKPKKGKLLVMPGRPTLGMLLKAVQEDFNLSQPDEVIILINSHKGEGVAIISNITTSPDKVWLLEHAKLLTMSGDIS